MNYKKIVRDIISKQLGVNPKKFDIVIKKDVIIVYVHDPEKIKWVLDDTHYIGLLRMYIQNFEEQAGDNLEKIMLKFEYDNFEQILVLKNENNEKKYVKI